MSFPECNGEDSYLQLENFEDWACPQCFKTISASRPPVFNADNCSCVEVASRTIGGHGHCAELATYEPEYHHYEETAPLYHNRAHSCASYSASVPCPEGPEHENLNLQVNNNYLPLVAEPGLNEVEHRCRASCNFDMSYPMQRFLRDPEARQSVYGTEHVETGSPSSSKFLSQELHVEASKKVHRGSPRSKLSWTSESSRSGEASVVSWGIADPLFGTGTWADGSRNAYTGEAYPLAMSGVTDRAAIYDDE